MTAEVNTPNLEPHMAEQVRLVTEIFPIMAGIEIALAPLPWPPNPFGSMGRSTHATRTTCWRLARIGRRWS